MIGGDVHLEVGGDQLIGWEVVGGLVLGSAVLSWTLYGCRSRHGGNVFALFTYSENIKRCSAKSIRG